MRLGLLIGFILSGTIFLYAQDNFQITYSASGDEVIEWIIPSNDGNLILGGTSNSLDSDGDGLIIKVDMNGNILWSKVIGGTSIDQIVKMTSCNDGGYIVIGNTSSFGEGGLDAWITRINEDGDVVWSDCFGTYSYDGARTVIQTGNGGFMVVGLTMNFGGAFMLSLNSEGDMVWEKEYFEGIVCWFNTVNQTDNGGFYVTGTLNHSGFGVHDIIILETTSTGNFVRCKYYGGQDDDSFRSLIPYEDGFLAVGDTWSYQYNSIGFLAKLNSNLVIEKAIMIGDNTVLQKLESACFISNSIYVADKLTDGTSYIFDLNPDLTLKRSWQFNPGDAAYSSSIISLQDNTVIISGSLTNDQTHRKDAYLVKFDPEEIAYDCNTVPHSTFIQNVNVQSNTMNLPEVNNYPIFHKLNIESRDITLQTHRLCILPPIADFSGPEQVCAYESVSFTNNCQNGETYHWTFQGGIPATSDSYNPGTIIYKNPGYFSIKLVVTNQSGSDSIVRYIIVNPIPEVHLGEDTIVNMGQSLILDAGPYMDHYLWQDGSTEETFEVIQDGMYWVRVIENNCIDFDTIFIIFDDCIASLEIPNCFTPNGDGFNETFEVECQNLIGFSMLIYNRWGRQLFESEDPEKGWDGKVNGQLCPIGTYFYLVRYATKCSSGVDKDGVKKGSVTLLE